MLTGEIVRPHLGRVAVAPIMTSMEVPVGPLDHDCDNIVTVPVESLGRLLGLLLAEQESALSAAISSAFDFW